MFMRLAMTAAALVALSVPAAAQGRPDARAMTCEQVRSLIAARGAVVLTTGRYTYDRYVRNGGQCFTSAERAVRASIPTRDTQSCPVYRCEVFDPEDRWRFRWRMD